MLVERRVDLRESPGIFTSDTVKNTTLVHTKLHNVVHGHSTLLPSSSHTSEARSTYSMLQYQSCNKWMYGIMGRTVVLKCPREVNGEICRHVNVFGVRCCTLRNYAYSAHTLDLESYRKGCVSTVGKPFRVAYVQRVFTRHLCVAFEAHKITSKIVQIFFVCALGALDNSNMSFWGEVHQKTCIHWACVLERYWW